MSTTRLPRRGVWRFRNLSRRISVRSHHGDTLNANDLNVAIDPAWTSKRIKPFHRIRDPVTEPNAPKRRTDVWVVIPALNEASSIRLVLRDLPPVGRTIVVDNGSTDQTAAVAADAGADVITEPRRGYGSACLAGLAHIEDLVTESHVTESRAVVPPAIVAFADADYSDHVDQLPGLLRPIDDGHADLVLGSRLLGNRQPGAMPPQSVYGNRLACFLMRHCFGGQYTDLGPFRAIRYDALKRLRMADTNFGWTIEMQIKAVRAGLRTLEVPADYRRREGVSKISGTLSGTVRAGSKILYTVAKHRLAPWRP